MTTIFVPSPQLLQGPGGGPIPHPLLRDVFFIDPASLRSPEGGDPYMVLADGRTVRQVRADHAAELLLKEASGAPSKFRLATEAEIAAFLQAEASRSAESHARQVALIKARAEEAYRRELASIGETPESVL